MVANGEPAVNEAPVPATAQIWAVCGIVLVFLLGSGATLNDFDTYWHVATGQWIFENLAIPDRDPFSHTKLGEPWMALEWLAEVILAFLHGLGGWPLVAIMPPVMLAATLVIMARSLSRHLSFTHTAVFVLMAMAMAGPHLLARPHVLAWPLLAWWTAELVRAADEERTPPWSLMPVMIVWSNLHGSFVLALGLFGLLAGEVTLALWRRERRLTLPWGWVLFGCLAVLASALTPHGLEKIVFVVTLMGQADLLTHIGEWQSPDFQRFSPLQLWIFVVFGAALCFGLRLPWTRVVMVLVLLHLALQHQRHIPLLGFLAPLFMAGPLGPQLRALADAQLEPVRGAGLHRLLQPLPTAAMTVVTAMIVSAYAYALQGVEPGGKMNPSAALAAVRAAKIEGPVLNQYDFGGYLIYSGVPTFIDGRADLYGNQFFLDHHRALALADGDALPELLEKHAITWTLLSTHNAAVALMDRLEGWRRLYADDIAVVHVREAVSSLATAN